MKRFLGGALLLGVCATLAQAELVSYWPLDEFPDELSTPDVVRGYDMELVTDGFFTAADNHVDGKFGKAFQFYNQNDGGGDQGLFAYIADEGDLLPINLQPEFTISMWARVDGVGQNDWRLFSESNVDGNNDPLFNIGTANNGADSSLDIYIRNNQVSTPTVNHPHTTAMPFDGEWSHIGWTYADGMHNVYVDGAYDSSYPMQSFGEVDPANVNATTIGGILRANASHWVTGIIDDVAVWNEVLPDATIAGLAEELTTVTEALEYAGTLPPFAIGDRGAVGTNPLTGARENQQFGEPVGPNQPGLLQSWYGVGNPGSKAGVDGIIATADRMVPAFHSVDGTWWSGSMAVTDVQAYPLEVEDAIADRGGENYTVKLEGEINIPEAGPYRFLDGVDDFAYFAIDRDGSGVPGDAPEEILINDNTWTDALSANNGGGPIVEMTFDDAGWYAVEFNMAEGGGGDHGMLYWDYKDGIGGNDDFFPLAQGDGVDDFDAVELMVPDDFLRGPSEPAPLVSGDVVASVPSRESGWEVDVNPADGTSDAFTLENPDDAIYTTKLNVDGIEFHINALGEVADGASFQFLVADQIIGTPVIATDGWSYDAATGSVVFGIVNPCDPNSGGDLDGNGTVEFADFLVLSGNFGQAVGSHTEGDIDCNGTVEFADFLTLSGNFGQQVGGTESVPEPAGFALFGLASLMLGCLRRRRS